MKAETLLGMGVAMMATVGVCGGEAIRIGELPAAVGVPSAPWVAGGDNGWRNGAPLFDLQEKGLAVTARGWVGLRGEELALRVEVRDDVHLNDQTGASIWNGDFLRVSVDAWGDGTGGEPPETAAAFGPDDVSIGFALSSKGGAQGWVYTALSPALEGACPAGWMDIRRDEATKTTTYDISLPWKALSSAPGLTPQFGVAVQVRNVNSADQKEPEHLRWGGHEGRFLPGMFKRLQAGRPPAALARIVAVSPDIWLPGQPAVALVAVTAGDGPQVLTATGPGESSRVEIARDADLPVRRYRIEYRPAPGASPAPLKIEIRPSAGGPATAEATLLPRIPGATVERLTARLDELLGSSPHPLFTRHLVSIRSVVLAEWARTSAGALVNPLPAAEVCRFADTILAGLNAAAGQWESYWRDGLPLCLAFTSPTDGTLQRYLLTLPKGWDPAKGRDEQALYPLFVELHGSGNPSPLAAVAQQLDPVEPPSETKSVVPSRRTFASVQRAGYHVMPHGRGNLGYRGVGEADVWEALDDVTRNWRYDESRQYLYGFSMGGGGTWRLATRTPDRWAAVAIYAPGIRWRGAPAAGVGENLRSMPVWMWTGEADRLIEDQRAAADELRRFGNEPVVQSMPGIGHNYLWEVQEKGVTWLQQFTRKRPDRFTFVADAEEHRGVWGVTVRRDITISAMPRFECRIEGQTIRIDSAGTLGLSVRLGEGGLGLAGDVTVVWNGKTAYQGPPQDIRLGEE